VNKCIDEKIQKDWEYLQASDHFYYMATKFFSDGAVHAYFNPYDTPYDAFMNYMNVLSDFEIRLNRFVPESNEQNEISKLNSLIKEKEAIIDQQANELTGLRKKTLKRKTGTKGTRSAGGTSRTRKALTKKPAKASRASKSAK
jgi:alpha-amylase